MVKMFTEDVTDITVLDMASGTGHLSATINEQNPDKSFHHALVEVDPVLARVSVHLANFLEVPFDIYPRDALMPPGRRSGCRDRGSAGRLLSGR